MTRVVIWLMASLSASPWVSASPEARSVFFVPVDAGMLGMYAAEARNGN